MICRVNLANYILYSLNIQQMKIQKEMRFPRLTNFTVIHRIKKKSSIKNKLVKRLDYWKKKKSNILTEAQNTTKN